jgi:hypothetical protein
MPTQPQATAPSRLRRNNYRTNARIVGVLYLGRYATSRGQHYSVTLDVVKTGPSPSNHHQLREITNEINHERVTALARCHGQTGRPKRHRCRDECDEAGRSVALGSYSRSQ